MLLLLSLFHLLWLGNIPWYIYIYRIFFYLFICWWTFKIFPYPAYSKQCYNKHWGTWMFSHYDFLWIHAQEWDSWIIWTSLVAWTVKNPPAMEDTWVWPLGQKGSLEKGWSHSNILAWRIPGTEEPNKLRSMGSQRVGQDWATNTFTSHFHGSSI